MPEPVSATRWPRTWYAEGSQRRLSASRLPVGVAGVVAYPSRAQDFWRAIKTAVVRVPVATPALE